MKRLIAGVTFAFFFALCGSWILLSQEPSKSICGTNTTDPTPNITLLQISCVDYDALKRVNPEFPWPSVKRTQVLVHVRAGDAVRVTVGGETRWADLSPHPEGAMHAMVQFEGMEHTAVDVRVFTEVK